MATTKAVVTQQHLTDIAEAIRTKGGTELPLLPSQMAAAIEAIPTSGGENGNGLPVGCPRVDLVDLGDTYEWSVLVYDARFTDSFEISFWPNLIEGEKYLNQLWTATISPNGELVYGDKIAEYMSGRGTSSLRITGGDYIVIVHRGVEGGRICAMFPLKGSECNRVAIKARVSVSEITNAGKSYCEISGGKRPVVIKGRTIGEHAVPNPTSIIIRNCDIENVSVGLYSYNLEYIKIAGSIKGVSSIGDSGTVNVDLSEADLSGVTSRLSWGKMFGNYAVNVLMPSDTNKGFRVSINIESDCLSHSSLISILSSLYDHLAAGTGETPTLTIRSANLSKLTDAEKAIATNKGWILA